MKYLVSGILAGFAAGILFFKSTGGMEIIPEFYCGLDAVDTLQWADSKNSRSGFVVPVNGSAYVIDSSCNIVNKIETGDDLVEFSGNGSFYIRYGKVSTDIELLGLAGERYLKMKSLEKPFLSPNAELILLLNGDHTSIRIFDKNGNQAGDGIINGRLCTSVEFAPENDFAACGFADGTYYFINGKGKIICSGMVQQGNVVKGVAVSPGGVYGFVHYGNSDSDWLRLVKTAGGNYDDTVLPRPHYVKTAMCVSDSGEGAFFDYDAVLLTDNDCDVDFRIPLPAKRPGYSTLSYGAGIYSLCYTKTTGESQLVFFDRRGDIIFAKEFPGQSFLGSEIRGKLIFLRGSDSLFAYSIHP